MCRGGLYVGFIGKQNRNATIDDKRVYIRHQPTSLVIFSITSSKLDSFKGLFIWRKFPLHFLVKQESR